MRRIAIINQKGGVGKTTTAVNLSAALASRGRRVCLLDLDPQGNATSHFGLEAHGPEPSMYDVLIDAKPLAEVRKKWNDHLWIAGSNLDLAAAEVELAGVVGREVILRDQLLQEEGTFDFVLMDCAPSLGVLTLNALSAANEVIIPLQPHYFALHGMSKLLETTSLVARRINPALRVTGIVVCMYDAATRLANEVLRDLEAFLEKGRDSNQPWSRANMFRTRIRRNIKLAECPSFGQPVFEYAPTCHGAIDYNNLAAELLGEPDRVVSARVVMSTEESADLLPPTIAARVESLPLVPENS
jgi:chromosome partitioning protein